MVRAARHLAADAFLHGHFTTRRAPFPAVVYFHGGGWVIGNSHAYDAGARAHEFFGAAAVLPAAKTAQSFAAEQLKDAFKE